MLDEYALNITHRSVLLITHQCHEFLIALLMRLTQYEFVHEILHEELIFLELFLNEYLDGRIYHFDRWNAALLLRPSHLPVTMHVVSPQSCEYCEL